MDADRGKATQLLRAMHSGNDRAADELLPLVYDELHRLARSYMRRERPNHTLQPTALIGDAYMKLIHEDVAWNNRAHFVAVAANVMRRVLVDHARAHNADRRAGKLRQVELQDHVAITPDRLDEVMFLDEALNRLAQENPRQVQVVELRYFGGLSVEEIAAHLGIADRSVKRDWALAKVWLFKQLEPHAGR